MAVLKEYVHMERPETKSMSPMAPSLAAQEEHPTGLSFSTHSLGAILPVHTSEVFGDADGVNADMAVQVTPSGDSRQTKRERPGVVRTISSSRQRSCHNVLFALYGLGILIVHLHSAIVAALYKSNGCLLEVRPWLQTVYNCIAFELNCSHGEHGDGSKPGVLEDLADVLNIRGLKAIVIASCAHLHVPPTLQTLTALQMIKIYNSTVEKWDSTAELLDEVHQDLQLLYVCDSNFSSGELPGGLLGDSFPSRLVDIEFLGTNLQSLPSNLHEKWTLVQFFVLERTPGISEVPAPLIKMKIPHLMLSSNTISSIPDDLLADQQFWMLILDGNPLQSLPAKIGSMLNVEIIGFAFTNVSTLPQWIVASANRSDGDKLEPLRGFTTLIASGTALCSEAGAPLRETANSWLEWVCQTTRPYVYPVEEERQWRADSLIHEHESR